MPVWFWLAIGAATVAAVSLLASAVFAAILRSMSREVTELLELEPLAIARAARTRAPVVRV